MKQSRAVESSARFFGLASSRVTSCPLNTAFSAWRTLDAAWPLKVWIQVGSGGWFTRKPTTTRLSGKRPSNVGLLAHDQHVDSMAVTPEPFARLTQHTDAAASGTGLDRGLSLRSTDSLPEW